MQPAEIVERLAALLPPLADDEACVALTLYRQLAQGPPVTVEALTAAAGLTQGRVRSLLNEWPGVFRDDHARVIGFWGLTQTQMAHRFTVSGRALFTWCAWDTLFLPALLDTDADVLSPSGLDRKPIHLHVTSSSAHAASCEPLFVSFFLPVGDAWTQDIVTSFCHHVFFLSGDEAARWQLQRPDTVLLSLDEAFDAGRRKNALQFRACLRTGASRMQESRKNAP